MRYLKHTVVQITLSKVSKQTSSNNKRIALKALTDKNKKQRGRFGRRFDQMK